MPDRVSRWQGTDDLSPAERALITPIHDFRRQLLLETIRDTRDLTDLEWRFVRYLQRYEGQIRTYHQIANHLWGTKRHPITNRDLEDQNGYASPYIRHIWVLASTVRAKLEFDPARPQHLATRRMAGYSWHDLPPGKSDGVDYAKLHAEHLRLARQMAVALGLEPDPSPQLGPAHPLYEGEVTEGRSERAET